MRRRVRAYLARFDPRLGPVVIIGFVAFTAYSAWWPFMVLWLTGPLGQSASVAGLGAGRGHVRRHGGEPLRRRAVRPHRPARRGDRRARGRRRAHVRPHAGGRPRDRGAAAAGGRPRRLVDHARALGHDRGRRARCAARRGLRAAARLQQRGVGDRAGAGRAGGGALLRRALPLVGDGAHDRGRAGPDAAARAAAGTPAPTGERVPDRSPRCATRRSSRSCWPRSACCCCSAGSSRCCRSTCATRTASRWAAGAACWPSAPRSSWCCSCPSRASRRASRRRARWPSAGSCWAPGLATFLIGDSVAGAARRRGARRAGRDAAHADRQRGRRAHGAERAARHVPGRLRHDHQHHVRRRPRDRAAALRPRRGQRAARAGAVRGHRRRLSRSWPRCAAATCARPSARCEPPRSANPRPWLESAA